MLAILPYLSFLPSATSCFSYMCPDVYQTLRVAGCVCVCVCVCVCDLEASGYQPSGLSLAAALEYSHIRPPTQNNNRHLTARQSLGKLDDYGSRHRQIDGNILLR
ncbi:hypothetical protein KUCAC02_032128, partial [Chaenocephalus aceratus]